MLVFVGGHAASGTRVIQHILRRAGFWIGETSKLNSALDYLPFTPLFNRILQTNNVSSQEIRDVVEEGRNGHSVCSLKEGFSMMCIEELANAYSNNIKYVLMIRNGLDQILTNHIMAESYVDKILGNVENFSVFEKRILFWAEIYEDALKKLEHFFTQTRENLVIRRYLIIRLEDLCFVPEREIRRLFQFLEIDQNPLDFIDLVQVKPTHLRQRFEQVNLEVGTYLPTMLPRLRELGWKTLYRFGYV